VSNKEKFQKLLFRDGIIYSKGKRGISNRQVNAIFVLIASAAKDTGENKKGTNKASLFDPPSGD
jgi:hypothetical protein